MLPTSPSPGTASCRNLALRRLLAFGMIVLLAACRPGSDAPPPHESAAGEASEFLVSAETIEQWLKRGNEGYQRVPAFEGGRTWVVSPRGKAGADGTAGEPLASIAEAVERAQAGDRIHVGAGTYSETVRFPRSGEPGKPIILEGERGPAGEWLSIMDLGRPVTGWEAAPEVGPGVYRKTVRGEPLHCLTSRGKQVLRIHDRLMTLPWDREQALKGLPMPGYGESLFRTGVSGYRFLVMPSDGQIVMTRRSPIPFWDGIEAIWGVDGETVYLRFRDGRHPDREEIRAAPAGNALTIEDQSYIVVRDLAVRGAEYAVTLAGPKATHNVIEENFITHGRDRITLTRHASDNLVRHNEVTLSYYGSDLFGFSSGDDDEDEAESRNPSGEYTSRQSRVRMNIYRSFKHIQGTDASADIGIRIQTAGPGNEIVGNHVFNGLKGLHCMGTPDLKVHGNVVHNMSSLTLVTLPGLKNAHFYDNLFFDSNILLRIHRYNTPGRRSEYHYRNVYRLPENDGRYIYVHFNADGIPFPPEKEHTIAIYHNTMIGGSHGIIAGSFKRGIAMAKTMVLNNIISTVNEPVKYLQAAPPRSSPERFDGYLYEVFDYNWVGGSRTDGTLPAWFGKHNINAANQQLWPTTYQGPLIPPPAVRGQGIDLSRPFTIAGKTYEPLPGMQPGYFSGKAPSPGAFQEAPGAMISTTR